VQCLTRRVSVMKRESQVRGYR